MQLASDEESVQSLNVADSADHTGKKRLANVEEDLGPRKSQLITNKGIELKELTLHHSNCTFLGLTCTHYATIFPPF